MYRWAPALFVIVLSACGGAAAPAVGSAPPALLASVCDYLSTPDFQTTLGHALVGYRAGPTCEYRDQQGNTCDVVVTKDASQYAAGQARAAAYGTVQSLAVGDQSYFSAKVQVPPAVWVFAFGFMKSQVFGGGLCGGHFGSANPRPLAVKLASKIASKL